MMTLTLADILIVAAIAVAVSAAANVIASRMERAHERRDLLKAHRAMKDGLAFGASFARRLLP